MRVALATSNPGKVREAQAILHEAGVEVFVPRLWLGEVETGTTFEENAVLKAVAALRLLRAPVLAEDAGIEVDALGGLPGVRSARFAGPAATDAANNARMLSLLEGAEEPCTARYRAVVALALPSGAVHLASGALEGRIVRDPRGEGGFGYDPLFVPAGMDRTAAELEPDEKNAISHRAQALRGLVEIIRTAAR